MAQVILRGKVWYSDFRYKGRRIRRPLDRDKREAIILLGRLLQKVKGERPGGAPPWETFKRDLFDHNAVHKEENTLKRDRAAFSVLEAHFRPGRFSDVTTKTLKALVTVRLREGMRPASIRREVSALKAAMRWGEEEYDLPRADWRTVKLPKVPKGRPHAHTREELLRLLRFARGAWRTVAWLGSRAGLRRGEIRWLEWERVRFAERFIRVAATDGWKPKDKDARDILLLDDLAAYLKKLPRAGPYVLGKDRPSLAVMSSYFKKLSRKAGLRGGIQTLRHTYFTLLINEGVNPSALQKWGGHANLETTLAYVDPSHEHPGEAEKVTPLKP